jgi:hypothetical protein
LEAFNTKLPKPQAEAPVEIIQEDDSVPHIHLKGQKKTEQEEIDAYKDKKAKEEEYEQKIQEQAEKEKQLERFKQREKEEQEALEEVARKAREEELVEESIADDIKETVVATDKYNFEDEVAYDMDPVVNPEWDKDEEPTISEQIEEVMEPERTRPDFTEVIEPEQAVQEMMEDPKKAMEEDVKIVGETARKTHLADMDELAVEPEIGEFTSGYKPMFVKKSQEKINKDAYVQNEEQTDNTAWKKIKTKQTSEDQYHEMQEKRIDTLMTKLDAGELQMEDLTPEDRQVIIDIRMQNESGDKIK